MNDEAGGIPYYLKYVAPGLTAEANIQAIQKKLLLIIGFILPKSLVFMRDLGTHSKRYVISILSKSLRL